MISRTTQEHYNKYEQMFQQAKAKGWQVDKLARNIAVPTIEEWEKSDARVHMLPTTQGNLDLNPHLNHIPLSRFDAYYYITRKYFPTASMAESVCLLKHALLFYVMGCEFEEEK